MDRIAALTLFGRIKGHWGLRPARQAEDAWLEMLERLDEGVAGTTYARLQRGTATPDPASFQRAATTIAGPATNHRLTHCELCHDSGWVTCTDHPDHRGHWAANPDRQPPAADEECMCNIVRPCRCSAGQAAAESHYGPRRSTAA